MKGNGDSGEQAGIADALYRHGGAHRHTHRHVVQGHGGGQHKPGGLQVMVATGTVVGVVVIFVVHALVNPGVEGEGDEKAQHQACRGDDELVHLLHGLGNHVEADNTQHQPSGKAQEQAGALGGLPLEQQSQQATQGQASHTGDRREKNEINELGMHGETPLQFGCANANGITGRGLRQGGVDSCCEVAGRSPDIPGQNSCFCSR